MATREERGLHLGGWPERCDGQPFLPWFVCGMPLWFAPLILVPVCGLLLVGLTLEGHDPAGLAVVPPFLLALWPVQSLVLLLSLLFTWSVYGERPDLSTATAFALLLRVVPVAFLVNVLAHLACLPLENERLTQLAHLAVSLVYYRLVLEMELNDVLVLWLVSGVIWLFVEVAVFTALL